MKRILGLLGWLGVGLVVAAVVIKVGWPDLQPYSKGLAIAGLVATGLYALSQWRDIGRSFQGRNVRYGSVAFGSVILVLAILVGLNYVSGRQHKIWDLTAAGQFSLSDQTKQLLRDLKKPLNVKVFYGGDAPVEPFKDRMASFQYLSSQISVEYINVEKDPLPAQKYDVKQYGTTLLEYDGRTEKVTTNEESDLVTSLKRLLEGKAKKIYFMTGHGEGDTAGTERDPVSYSGAASELKADNLEVATLTLAQETKVPDDATILAIAGPKADLLPQEMDRVRAFLKRGGKLFLMLDPQTKADMPPLTNLIALAKEWGIDVGNDLVVDVSGAGQRAGMSEVEPIARPTPGHPVTEGSTLMAAFSLARSVTPVTGGTDGKTAQKLYETSPRSWAENDLKTLFSKGDKAELKLDPTDKAGPISIAAAVSAPSTDAPAAEAPDAPKPETRLIVVGDSDFASNSRLPLPGNRAFLLNGVKWLSQSQDFVTIKSRDPEDRRINLTAAEGEAIVWVTLLIVPVLLLGNGFRTWWKRR